MDLTFAEQVKIILSRRGMTIKELAELIEKHTGKKMSRQNLTQRLGRDNFQEQDMRMIAGILGCPFYLNILDENISVEAEEPHREDKENYIEEVQEPVEAVYEAPAAEEYVEEVYEEPAIEEYVEEVYEEPAAEEYAEEVYEEPAMQEESIEEILEEAAALERENKEFEHRQSENKEQEKKQDNRTVFEDGENKGKKHSWTSYLRRRKKQVEEPVKPEEEVQTQPVEEEPKDMFETETISLEEDDAKEVNSFTEYAEEKVKELQPEGTEEEDLEKGDINPYTGHEYQSNSVRMHPSRIGYVQVYDRGEHQWTDMTEWAFLGYQERKKVLLGKDYEPPIYLD